MPEPLQFQIAGTEVTKSFDKLEPLVEWVRDLAQAWDLPLPQNSALHRFWNRQRTEAEAFWGAAQQLQADFTSAQDENARLAAWHNFKGAAAGHIGNISGGTLLTRESTGFHEIAALAQTDADAAAVAYLAFRSDGQARVQEIVGNGQFPWRAFVVRSVLTIDQSAITARLEANQRRIEELTSALERATSELNAHVQSSKQAEVEVLAVRAREWESQKEDVENQWIAIKKTYDEDLALDAPAKYWSVRAADARESAMWYAGSFLLVSLIAVVTFIWFGVPFLRDSAKATNGAAVVASLLPVLVPLFVGVWLLRILGRLLSESLQLIQDARERVVMVKTFLALIHDDVRGKSLVTEEDRVLILHSLFRPSAVSSTDDSPPVNWFDVLLRRVGGGKQ